VPETNSPRPAATQANPASPCPAATNPATRPKASRHSPPSNPSAASLKRTPLVNLISPRDYPASSQTLFVANLRQDSSLKTCKARARKRRPCRPYPSAAPPRVSPSFSSRPPHQLPRDAHRTSHPHPPPLTPITRIDIHRPLSGQRFTRSDPIGGAVNLLTQPPASGSQICSWQAQVAAASTLLLQLLLPIAPGTSAPRTLTSRLAEQLPAIATPPTASSPIATTPRTPLALRNLTWLTTKRPAQPTYFSPPAIAPTMPSLLRPLPLVGRTKAGSSPASQQLCPQTAPSFVYRATPTSSSSFVDRPHHLRNPTSTTSYELCALLPRRHPLPPTHRSPTSSNIRRPTTIHSNSLMPSHPKPGRRLSANLSLRALRLRRVSSFPSALATKSSPEQEMATGNDNVFLPSRRRPRSLTRLACEPPPATAFAYRPTSTLLPDPTTIAPQPQTRILLELRSRCRLAPHHGGLTLDRRAFASSKKTASYYSKFILATPVPHQRQPWQAINSRPQHHWSRSHRHPPPHHHHSQLPFS